MNYKQSPSHLFCPLYGRYFKHSKKKNTKHSSRIPKKRGVRSHIYHKIYENGLPFFAAEI